MIGKTFSHFKILEKLGEGGMGVLYLALDTLCLIIINPDEPPVAKAVFRYGRADAQHVKCG